MLSTRNTFTTCKVILDTFPLNVSMNSRDFFFVVSAQNQLIHENIFAKLKMSWSSKFFTLKKSNTLVKCNCFCRLHSPASCDYHIWTWHWINIWKSNEHVDLNRRSVVKWISIEHFFSAVVSASDWKLKLYFHSHFNSPLWRSPSWVRRNRNND